MSDIASTKLAYSINEAVAATGLGRGLLYKQIALGNLQIVKMGKRTIITEGALRAWLDGAATATPCNSRAGSRP